MKNYVIGDIQGCYQGLKKVLDKAGFRPQKDKLWAVGDLVARGPDSLKTLQYLYDLGPHFETVLGNHDLHLMAAAHGVSKIKAQDKLDSLLKHKHFNRYIDFLLTKPLAHQPIANTLITHAGLYPGWSFKKALKMSSKVQEALTGTNPTGFFGSMYGNLPNKWDKRLSNEEKLRFTTNACTRMRYINTDLTLDFQTKTHPQNAPEHLTAWFDIDNPKTTPEQHIIFGHWASLLGQIPQHIASPAKVTALDTGYVWGNTMSLYCLETQKIIRHHA